MSIINTLVGNLGVNIQGAMLLTVVGRKSGKSRSVVVNPLELDGYTYVLSPRGETQWVKNIRAAGTALLRRGRTQTNYTATEITDADEKVRVIHAYLQRWSWQVQRIMGVSKGSPEKELRAIIEQHPVFLLRPA